MAVKALQQACELVGLAVDWAALMLSTPSRSTTVFVFHAIADPEQITGFKKDFPFHTPAVFKEFIAWIAKQATITTGETEPGLAGTEGQNRKSATLTFDDGFEDHYTTVYPLLQDYGMTGVFFVPTGLIGRPGGLSKAMVREMSDNSMRIGSHSVSHCKLSQCEREQVRRELTESKAYLEDLTGRACDEVAYPYGAHNEMVKEEAIRAGYKRAFASSPHAPQSDEFALPRIAIPDTLSAWRYKTALHDSGRWRRVVGRNERIDRFVHGTLGYNSERLRWPMALR
jgi:peptidoglycan/xylan/chitin deacetylase (PgdA/CDA1 family)